MFDFLFLQQVLKTETNLLVNDTDHSDTTSEVSDEGYRSLGIIQDKTKKRSSLYSQNSGEDVEDNGMISNAFLNKISQLRYSYLHFN